MGALTMMERNEIKEINRPGQFFSHLSKDALRDFESMELPRLYAANTVLFEERQTPTSVLILLQGQVKLSINSSEGRRLILRVAKPGEILGLSDVLSGKPYDMAAETLHACKIASVRRQDFLNFLLLHAEAYCGVTCELSLQYSEAREQLRNVGLTPTAPKKLARLLLEWCATGQKTELGMRMKVSLTHEEIGEFIGASRETVTRTLGELKQQHLVAQQGATMMIPNLVALEAFACA